jgi:hypothetical protein
MVIHRVGDKTFFIAEEWEEERRRPSSGGIYVEHDPLTGKRTVHKTYRGAPRPIKSDDDDGRTWCPQCSNRLVYWKEDPIQPWRCFKCSFISADIPGQPLRNGSLPPGYAAVEGKALTADNLTDQGIKTTKPVTRSIGDARKRSRFADHATDPTDPKGDLELQRIMERDSAYLVDYKVIMPQSSAAGDDVMSSAELRANKDRQQ